MFLLFTNDQSNFASAVGNGTPVTVFLPESSVITHCQFVSIDGPRCQTYLDTERRRIDVKPQMFCRFRLNIMKVSFPESICNQSAV